MPPLQGLGIFGARFYKHSIPTGFKRVLAYTRFVDKIQQSNIRTEKFQECYRRKRHRKKTEQEHVYSRATQCVG